MYYSQHWDRRTITYSEGLLICLQANISNSTDYMLIQFYINTDSTKCFKYRVSNSTKIGDIPIYPFNGRWYDVV